MSHVVSAGRHCILRSAATVVCAIGLATGTAGVAWAQTAPEQQQVVTKVTHDVMYVTEGARAREGGYPYPAYTATVDAAVAQRAASLARSLASGTETATPGLQSVNRVPTGWAHQREIVSRGTYTPRSAGPYEIGLYGYGAGPGGAPDLRFELMAGPKERTAVGVALVPTSGEVVVVVVNGYAAEPAIGPAVAPVPLPATPGPHSASDALMDALRDALASGLVTSSSGKG